jgi:5-methylcytosine-specific restriction enzyme A
MPKAAKTTCSHYGCAALVDAPGNCDAHRLSDRASAQYRRSSSTARGYGYRWQKVSKSFLKSHPLCECVDCKAGELRVIAAAVVDHVVPHRGDMQLFWDRLNWQAMSKECHDHKTATQDRISKTVDVCRVFSTPRQMIGGPEKFEVVKS